jgi:dolichol-phosphate mannosyltransferase
MNRFARRATDPVPAIDHHDGSGPRVSIVVTVYNEADQIVSCLDRIFESVRLPCEVLVVYDMEEDTTRPFAEEYAVRDPRVKPTLQTYGRGPARAIRYGFDAATAPVVVVTMADGCDDPSQIDALVKLVERGVVVAAASRYMRGGQQVGGPWLKQAMSRTAGRSLKVFARVGTNDATNSYKAYSKEFVRRVGIESDAGFEVGLELVAKARRYRQPVAEIPTIWLDRAFGVSNFKLAKWLPKYLSWWWFAFGPALPYRSETDQVNIHSSSEAKTSDPPAVPGIAASAETKASVL